MVRSELGNRIANALLGKRIEGKVAAVLPSGTPNVSRYLVEAEGEIVDIDVLVVESHGTSAFPSYVEHPPLKRGEEISRRTFSIRPWVDGQII